MSDYDIHALTPADFDAVMQLEESLFAVTSAHDFDRLVEGVQQSNQRACVRALPNSILVRTLAPRPPPGKPIHGYPRSTR